MMSIYFIRIISFLQNPHLSICSLETANSSQLVFTCPNGKNLTQLPFSINDILWPDNITSFLAQGENNTRGPFISIPTNICWMSNITVSSSLCIEFDLYDDILSY